MSNVPPTKTFSTAKEALVNARKLYEKGEIDKRELENVKKAAVKAAS